MTNQHPVFSMTTFARFYAATQTEGVRVVRQALTNSVVPNASVGRDYYRTFRNTLRPTHWTTGNIADFEYSIDRMILSLRQEQQRNNYRVRSQEYVAFWRKQENAGATFFKVPPTKLKLAEIELRVNPEVGMSQPGDNLALKLWFAAQRPKLQYRRALQYIMETAQGQGWVPGLQLAVWDIQRGEILPRPLLPRDFGMTINSQIAAFHSILHDLAG